MTKITDQTSEKESASLGIAGYFHPSMGKQDWPFPIGTPPIPWPGRKSDPMDTLEKPLQVAAGIGLVVLISWVAKKLL
ncbi:MAG: hypothetical protein ACXIT9_07005 [Nitritalea sp.]